MAVSRNSAKRNGLLVMFLLVVSLANGDIYMHNPRGGNDRNCGRDQDNRQNANLLFDSQNNDKGGYSCPRAFPFACYKLADPTERAACNAQNTANTTKEMVTCDGTLVESAITNPGGLDIIPPTQNKMMYFYEGSEIMVQWTNQHGFGQNNELHSNIVIQYACEDTLADMCGEIPDDVQDTENIMTFLGRTSGKGSTKCIPRDGFPVNNNNNANDASSRLNGQATTTIPFDENNPNAEVDDVFSVDDQDDCRYPRHEGIEFYLQCRLRKRNENLYIGDRNVVSDFKGAARTKQNQNGDRYGYECPEERDYYPYWHWSPWRDIANIVSDDQFCEATRTESGNVVGKGRCAGCATCREFGQQPNNQVECESVAQQGTWVEDGPHGDPAPQCIIAPRGQQNMLGTVQDGNFPHFNWTVPSPPNGADSAQCFLRVRYNISTLDFTSESRFADKSSNGANARIRDDDSSEEASYVNIQFDETLANQNVQQAPGARVALNINSNQFPRTFEDRSYKFEIRKRSGDDLCTLPNRKIHNVNVKGKRGNIVQTYPAHEYDWTPNHLTCEAGEGIHFQWTGSDYNPNRNDNNGEGGPEDPQGSTSTNTLRADRSNLVESTYFGGNYPLTDVAESKFLSEAQAVNLALTGKDFANATECKAIETLIQETKGQANEKQIRERHWQNCAKINTEIPYFDGGVVCCGPAAGDFTFLSTRNNNFSNRSQKLTITVKRNTSLIIGLTVGLGGAALLAVGFFGFTAYRKRKGAYMDDGSKAVEVLSSTPLTGDGFATLEIVTAKFDHRAEEKGELSFKKGQQIRIVKTDESGWWQGEINGRHGIFPSSYVETARTSI